MSAVYHGAMLTVVLLAATLSADARTLDTLTVTARRLQPAAAQVEAVSVLDADTIARVGATHAAELLTRVPGAWISRGSAQEQLVAIRSPVLTGAGACGAFLMLDDGVPIRPAGWCNVNQLFELNTEQAGALEVLRGPGTAVHGSNALHGVINVRPREPGDSPAQAFALEFGPDRYRRAQGSIAGGLASTPWRIDGYGVSTRSFRAHEGFDQQKLRLQWQQPAAFGAPRLQLAASNLNQETAGFVTGRDAFRDARRRGNENPEAFRDATSVQAQGHWQWALSARQSLSAVPYARYQRMDFLQHFTPGKPRELSDSQSAGMQWLWRRHAALDVQAGVDLEWTQGELLERQDTLAAGSAALQAIRPLGRHYDYRVDSFNSALFVQVQGHVGRLELSAGARVERLRYRYDNRAGDGNLRDDGTPCGFGGCLFNRPADRRDVFDDASAQLGLRLPLRAGTALVARYARAFRMPQVSELYRLQRGQDVADLAPETLHGPELGLRHAAGALQLDIDAYRYRKRHVIGRDALGFNFSDGATRHRGIEVQARWQAPRDWWVQGNAAYARHRYAFDRDIAGGERIRRGNDVDTAPRWLAGARVGHEQPTSGRFELEWVHVGAYWLDAGNSERYRGHDLWHLRWQRALAEDWQLAVRVMNLGNRRYAERADLAFATFRYFPGAGRSLFVELAWRRD